MLRLSEMHHTKFRSDGEKLKGLFSKDEFREVSSLVGDPDVIDFNDAHLNSASMDSFPI